MIGRFFIANCRAQSRNRLYIEIQYICFIPGDLRLGYYIGLIEVIIVK